MPGDFYQHACDIIGEDVYHIVVAFFVDLSFQDSTHTNLVMLPKELVVNTLLHEANFLE